MTMAAVYIAVAVVASITWNICEFSKPATCMSASISHLLHTWLLSSPGIRKQAKMISRSVCAAPQAASAAIDTEFTYMATNSEYVHV